MYEKFKELDGTHPWRDVSLHGYVDYQARYRPNGRVLYFNYSLARELQLISPTHPRTLNGELEQTILDTFSLQIINEFDLKHKRRFPADRVKPGCYMATRYLQTQHKNKRGKTSGDGRSIWNGSLKTKKLVFDISSRGTGATILSPGAQESEDEVKTGDLNYAYASGLAELDEMLGSAVMSEIFYHQDIPTERCLAVIGYADGSAIGVRSAPNLIRPAHLFRYLKLGMRRELKDSLDYFIKRQVENRFWQVPQEESARYSKSLDYLARSYGRLAAVLQEEYIFNWLAWDGDNMLASGAILDYGSIRQFAAKHDKYRFKDVDRYSASLTEQRYWARVIVQTFAQAIDLITHGRKQNLKSFKDAPCLQVFDDAFDAESDQRVLRKIGFGQEQIEKLMRTARKEIREFHRALSYFEDLKVSKGIEKLPDGVTHQPIFLIRNLLRVLPAYFTSQSVLSVNDESAYLPDDMFCRLMAASYVGKKDLQRVTSRHLHIKNFQRRYLELVAALGEPLDKTLRMLQQRSAIINHRHRLTGDSLVAIIEDVLARKWKHKRDGLQEALDAFIDSQVLIPERWQPVEPEQLKLNTVKSQLLQMIQQNLEQYKESV